MSVKRKKFSTAAEAVIQSATTAALAGSAPGVFATHRERIAATMGNPRAAGVAGFPHAGIDPDRIAAAIENNNEATRAAIDAAKASGQIATRAEQRISEVAAHLQAAEQKLAMLENGSTGTVAYRSPSVGASLVQRIQSGEADAFGALAAGNTSKAACKLNAGIRAALVREGSGSSSDAGVMPSQAANGGVFAGPAYRPSLLSILPSRRVTRDAVETVKINGTGDAGAQVLEGDTKADVEMDGQLIRNEICTYAATTSASKQVLADADQLAGAVDSLLRSRVMAKVEAELISGDGSQGHVSGLLDAGSVHVPVSATNAVDAIGEVVSSMTDQGYAPGVILMTATDWQAIAGERAQDGHFVLAVPTSPAPLTLWGVQVILSAAVPAGTAIVLDAGFVTILDREELTVAASEHHSDYFARNLVMLRAECRIGLEVRDAFAVRAIDLHAASSS